MFRKLLFLHLQKEKNYLESGNPIFLTILKTECQQLAVACKVDFTADFALNSYWCSFGNLNQICMAFVSLDKLLHLMAKYVVES